MGSENENHPETRSTHRMLPPERPDRIHVAFDDHRLVANAGLILPDTLAHHLVLDELVDRHVDLGDAPGRANAGYKLLTLVTKRTACPARMARVAQARIHRKDAWGLDTQGKRSVGDGTAVP